MRQSATCNCCSNNQIVLCTGGFFWKHRGPIWCIRFWRGTKMITKKTYTVISKKMFYRIVAFLGNRRNTENFPKFEFWCKLYQLNYLKVRLQVSQGLFQRIAGDILEIVQSEFGQGWKSISLGLCLWPASQQRQVGSLEIKVLTWEAKWN